MRLIDADKILDFINEATGITYYENLLDIEPKYTRDFYDVGKHNGQVDTFLKVKDYIENHAEEFNIKRKIGKWMLVTNGRGGHECSECHAYAPSYQNGDEFISDFCPYCGADMRDNKEV